jgi:putative spermidine/putrescine transport system permease protein
MVISLSSNEDHHALDEARAEVAEAESLGSPEVALAVHATSGPARSPLATLAWIAPGSIWLVLFLIAPLLMIVLVSLWQRTPVGFEPFSFTVEAYTRIFDTPVYLNTLRDTIIRAIIVTGLCILIGYPIAFYLARCVKTIKFQIALFIVVLAPFWVAYVVRIIAWLPVLGRQGVINYFLVDVINVVDEPISALFYSTFAITLALVQLYVLFMVTPIFFQLATLDNAAIEAARDLGANPGKVFREVIFPLSLPGVLIGCIFVFVLVMGEFATVRIIGGGTIQSVGTLVNDYYTIPDLPAAAAAATILVAVMTVGVAVLLRFSKIREVV